MTKRVKNVIEAVREMDDSEKRELVRILLESGFLSEDEEDALVITSRQSEPTRSYRDFLEELRKDGKPV